MATRSNWNSSSMQIQLPAFAHVDSKLYRISFALVFQLVVAFQFPSSSILQKLKLSLFTSIIYPQELHPIWVDAEKLKDGVRSQHLLLKIPGEWTVLTTQCLLPWHPCHVINPDFPYLRIREKKSPEFQIFFISGDSSCRSAQADIRKCT